MSKAEIKFHRVPSVEEAEVDPSEGIIVSKGTRYELNKLSLGAPVSGTVYGTLLNYRGGLAELGEAVHEPPYQEPPKAPVLYIKPRNTLSGHGLPIPLPEDVSQLEVGASLGVVIGRRATRVKEADALDYVAGYTVVNDVSIPHDRLHRPAVKQKARDGFCPIGPWVIQCDAVVDPDALGVRVYVNGELRQENSTTNLIRSVARLLADVTEFMTLNPGDALLVGVPEGAPLVRVDDRIRIEIDQVGILENPIVNAMDGVPGGGA
ncbi:5-carboxy-2-oxohept-3-enedioate decarboxylase HpaG1 subunit [Melghirimyces thermohalophilus]|uniref:5-carboxy-2-oxohept-3-enedioate decarboxylase HpaG1 subunit n=1 Tax=Melghirimyces thermohalophilus TaxID=1236220 RepID=A0A1G6NTH7_9BACL|nr:fumarylacetoacetate hydrolase family protein [Melghirimyces thermohalophilus]SDC71300.1 5-carboxy-2-oxohept-3-enedioate decarboxylase HpaG1 subunit [Melghirimyces thermohalophilus]